MSDKFSFRGGDTEGVADGDYVLTVAGGHVTGLSPASAGGGGSGVVETIVPGTGIAVDDTDPANPVVSATGGTAVPLMAARCYRVTNQTLTNGVVTPIDWTGETFDTDGFHDAATNTTRLIVPAGGEGYYRIAAQVYFSSLSTTGARDIRIMLNGTTRIGLAATPSATSGATALGATATVYLVPGDYIELWANQTSGGDLTANSNDTWLSMHRIGENGSAVAPSSTDPRVIFRDDCAGASLPAGASATGVTFDTTNLRRLLTGAANVTTPTFPLRGTIVIVAELAHLSGLTAGDLQLTVNKGASQVARIASQTDGNIVAYGSSTAVGNTATTTATGPRDGQALRFALTIDISGQCSATVVPLGGGAVTPNANSQKTWGISTHGWTSGLAGLAAGDALTVSVGLSKPGAADRVCALSRLVVTNGALSI